EARRAGCARPGTSVRWKGTPHRAVADERGFFSLPLLPGRLTASAPGHLIAGPSLRLRPLPPEDNALYEWVDPAPSPADEGRCANCHREIHREWAGSAHSRSSASERFLQVYARLLREKPDGSAVCASCHAPALPDGEALGDLREAEGFKASVHCDYCHKVAGLGEGTLGLTHGKHLLRLLRPKEGQLFFGPLDDVDRGEDAYSPLYRDSRYCAACHEGNVFGTAVYTTYSEWRASPAAREGKQCQDCHMRPTGRMANVAPGRGGIARDPRTLGNHSFWDGSQAEMLRRSLTLEGRIDGGSVVAVVTARGAGHRVPTGWIERELALEVQGFDVAGRSLGHQRWTYAKQASGPFWDLPEVRDTRLVPEVPDERRFRFGEGLSRVRVRLVHRRYPGGPAITVADQEWE
ncbi:MAG: cytochrome c family protein, partial [Gemmataceae bacterium]|nr:cytochrome c family protein [Gemmataceae bacterium]